MIKCHLSSKMLLNFSQKPNSHDENNAKYMFISMYLLVYQLYVQIFIYAKY